jgi:DNA topoisomerase-1
LVRELEANGVGRPSTYAQTIRTIQNREYVKKEKSRLAPTDLGMTANDWLVKHLPELLDVKFTARMESQLDSIEEGKLQWQNMLEGFYEKFGVWLKQAVTGDSLPTDKVQILLDLFHDGLEWAPPRKAGRTTYDDKKFISDLRDRTAEGELLTNKQTSALFRLMLNYAQQLSGVEQALEAAGALEPFKEVKEKQESRASSGTAPDAPEIQSLLGALAKVSEWDEPTTRGRRTFDDKKFFESLRDQAASGRNLSANQVSALRKLVGRYRARIPGFEEIAQTAGVEVEEVDPAKVALIQRLLPLGADVTEWNEPTKGRGGRVFDDHEFFESVSGQFDKKGILSDRQIGALKRMIGKYKEQIPNFAERTQGIDFTPPQRSRRAPAKKK